MARRAVARGWTDHHLLTGRPLSGFAQYLRTVQHITREAQPSGSLGMFGKWRIAGRIVDAYPQLGYPNFMRDGLEAVWREEAAKAR